jgi:aspartate ammonia-lyase
MKTTNEIEKQLERKADAYLEQKAKEMIAIRKQIEQFLDIELGFVDYITEYHGYCNAEKVDKKNYVSYHASHVIQNKLIDELAENYKERLVKKYTKELLTKLDIFE